MTNNWQKFTKNEQFAAIGAEVVRASIWEGKDKEKFHGAISRALALLDASLREARWREEISMLLFLREELARYYSGARRGIKALQAAM